MPNYIYISTGLLIIMFEDKTQKVNNKYICEYLHSVVILQEISNRISMQKSIYFWRILCTIFKNYNVFSYKLFVFFRNNTKIVLGPQN